MPRISFKIEHLWDEAKFKPNNNQAAAIKHVEGPLYLPAGPGSGKTRVLLWRTLNLIVFHDVRPEEIYLSTFTEKAALQLREGLRAMMGIVTNKTNQHFDISRMYVGTVHSLCQLILTDRRFTPERSRPIAPLLMDELSQYLYLYKRNQWTTLTCNSGLKQNANRFINDCFGDNSNSRHNAVSNAISFFNRLSEECIDPACIRRTLRDKGLRQLLELYTTYRQSLEDGRMLRTDFSLLQQKALHRLAEFEMSGQIFKHVIIDEYQDTNTVQERLFFSLAKGHKNICIVGDDDQALYRFRGATVENFVEFSKRCKKQLGMKPNTIPLSVNYRSRRRIVKFYQDFINGHDWRKPGSRNTQYRVSKKIKAHSTDSGLSVIASAPGSPQDVCVEIAGLVSRIIAAKKVDDPNQIAFLYPSLKSPHVERMITALAALGLQAYAPRAGRFLEVHEAVDIFGLFLHVFGRPDVDNRFGGDYQKFCDWIDNAYDRGEELINEDNHLKHYISAKQKEINMVVKDYTFITTVVQKYKWDLNGVYQPDAMLRRLTEIRGLSRQALKNLQSGYVNRSIRARLATGNPFSLKYVINRATSLDWNVLDLFYRLCGFKHFQEMFDLAEKGTDEGPICNLSLISEHLSRFMDEYTTMLSGEFLSDSRFLRVFFSSYLYALYRRGESEYEDAEDPFPRGRIPFLTIHQAKGLEFPIVVLANPRKDDKGPQAVERMVQPLLDRAGEPLDRMAGFDIMRMFYVALSRAQNLLILAHYRGQGQRVNEPICSMLNDSNFPRIVDFNVRTLPKALPKTDDLPKTYSYTGDYLLYNHCPRHYMIFRKYGFVPSRSQTMFFGSLVHQTLEDLHQRLILERKHA